MSGQILRTILPFAVRGFVQRFGDFHARCLGPLEVLANVFEKIVRLCVALPSCFGVYSPGRVSRNIMQAFPRPIWAPASLVGSP